MAVRTVTISITGTSAKLQAALRDAGLASDEESSKISGNFDSIGEHVGGVFGKLSSLGSAVLGPGNPISNGLDNIGKKFDDANTKGQKFGTAMKTLGGVAAVGLAAGFAGVAYESVEMADKFDTAQAQLQNAVKNSGESFAKAKPSIDATYQSMSNLGFNSATVATAMTGLVTSTGSVSRSEQILSTAADLARAKHISLTDATSILQKTLAGSTRALTQMGLNLDIGSAKATALDSASKSLAKAQTTLTQTQEKIASGSLKGVAAQIALQNAQTGVQDAQEKLTKDQQAGGDILDAIKKKTEGAANAYGQTLAGQMDIARAKVDNLGASFGEKLIPVITKAISVITSIVDWFSKHKAAAIALGIAIGTVLVAAMGAFVVSLFAAEGALAFIIGPIGLVMAAVAGLTFVIVELATHWQQVWSDIKNWFDDAVNFLRSGFGTLVTLIAGPLAPLIILGLHWQQVWGDIKSVIQDAWNFLKGIFDDIEGGIQDVTNAIGKVTSTISSVAHTGGIANPLNWDTGGPVPGAVGQPVRGVVHGGEFVLSHNMVTGADTSWMAHAPHAVAAAIRSTGIGSGSGSGTSQTVNVTANTNASGKQIADEIGWHLRTAR